MTKIKKHTLKKDGFNQNINFVSKEDLTTIGIEFQIIINKDTKRNMVKYLKSILSNVKVDDEVFYASDTLKVVEVPDTLEDKSFSSTKTCKANLSLYVHQRNVPTFYEDRKDMPGWKLANEYAKKIIESLVIKN